MVFENQIMRSLRDLSRLKNEFAKYLSKRPPIMNGEDTFFFDDVLLIFYTRSDQFVVLTHYFLHDYVISYIIM